MRSLPPPPKMPLSQQPCFLAAPGSQDAPCGLTHHGILLLFPKPSESQWVQTLLSTDPHEGWIAFQQGMGIMERGEGKKERERALQPASHGDSSREAEVQATHRVPHQEGSLRKEHKLQCR